jgi:hypothetical protein
MLVYNSGITRNRIQFIQTLENCPVRLSNVTVQYLIANIPLRICLSGSTSKRTTPKIHISYNIHHILFFFGLLQFLSCLITLASTF